MRTLIALDYSPWSEKALWAFDHHGVSYELEHYQPMIGEPGLRMRTRKLRGRVSVPVLIEGADILTESWDIARRADALGSAEPLFPMEHMDAIREWHERGQGACAVGRLASIRRTAANPEAMNAQIDTTAPAPLRPVLRPTSGLVLRWFKGKYADTVPADKGSLRHALIALREALDGGETILDRFTFADIAMAVVLQFVEPVDERFIQLDPRIRPTWQDPELAEEFADLLEWRDRLYDERRRPHA